MASVDWQKIKTAGEIKSILRHNDRDCRLKDNHSNEHINKNLTGKNLQTCDYATVCQKYDERIAYLDSQPKANKRKDRVTAIGFEIPIPTEIPDDKIVEFAYNATDVLEDLVGYKNFLASYIHVDEVHDYVDSQTKQTRTSMRHIHTYFIPEVNDKLNCNAISKKKNMIEVNNAIDKMCVEKFGVRFLNGEKSKSTESVESLKLKSKALELEQREKDIEGREEAVAHDEREIEKRERAVETREDEADVIYKAAYKKLSEADKKLSEATQREQAVSKREQSVQQATNSMTVKLAALQNRADELEERENKLKERELNFKREVRKEAESLLERQKNATATLEQLENNKINNQLEMLTNKFNSND